jgi:Ca-activated chloride channel homolog
MLKRNRIGACHHALFFGARSLLMGSVLVIVPPGVSYGQSPSAGHQPSSAAEDVSIVVTVETRKGALVADLGPDDFVIRNGGLQQAVHAFARATDATDDPRLRVDVALLLDMSGSMGDRLRATGTAVAAFLEAVPRAGELLVIPCHNKVEGFRYRAVSRERALELIASASSGGTALYDAVRVAIANLESGPGRHVIVLLSDGEDTASRSSYGDLIDVLRSSRTSRTTIYPVALRVSHLLGSRRGQVSRSTLQEMADATGGKVHYCHDVHSLPGIYDQIIATLSSQYVLGFIPDTPGRVGSFRKLKVEVKHPGYRTRHREGYVRSAMRPGIKGSAYTPPEKGEQAAPPGATEMTLPSGTKVANRKQPPPAGAPSLDAALDEVARRHTPEAPQQKPPAQPGVETAPEQATANPDSGQLNPELGAAVDKLVRERLGTNAASGNANGTGEWLRSPLRPQGR